MSFRVFCLNTLCVSSLLAGIGEGVFFPDYAQAEGVASSQKAVRAPLSAKKQPNTDQTKKAEQGQNKQTTAPVAAKQEDLVVKASRSNRMYVTNGGDLGVLGHKKGLDVPFNIRSYNSSLILNQQSQTLGDVLLNDPTVRTTMGYGNYAQLFQIRGFTLYGDDIAIDGLYGVTPRQLVSPQLYDSVQVLNGASAFLNGAAPGGSAIGGNVNLIPKRAASTDITRVTGDYTSSGQGGGAFDLSRRFGKDRAYGFRFNAAGMDGETPIKGERHDDIALGGSFDWHNDDTRINMNMNYQKQQVFGGRSAIIVSSLATDMPTPKATSPSKNWGQRWAYTDLSYLFGTLNIEHDFGEHITTYAKFGAQSGNEMGNYATTTLTNSRTGDGSVGAMADAYNVMNEATQAGVRAHVNTGFIKHEINAGGSAIWEESDAAYAMSLVGESGNIYHPTQFTPNETYAGGSLRNPGRVSWNKLYSLFLSDTMTFWHDRIALTGGFRYQDILSDSYNYGSGSLLSHYNSSAFSPVIGFVVHPVKNFALYFNRIQGLSAGTTVGSTYVNAGQTFAPYQSTQYEVGAKYDVGRFSAGVAFFQTSMPYGMTEPYGDTGESIYTQSGKQRNRGMELTFNGEILRGLRFNGGLTLIDAKQVHTAGGEYNGKTVIGVPNYTINGNLEYDVPFVKGLTLVGRVVSTGKQQFNNVNSAHLPAWSRFDLGARYTFLVHNKPLTARFEVDNVGNQRYWASVYQSDLVMGDPETFKFSVSADL
ncbi:TonB-dependent receptor [Acetobacter pasteurianus]|uniref:Ferrichrome siderophore receptor FcuA n=2 Tax=Acetobacter pasteurianus TaxID=438 RepID=C7JB68_ACEP3|nr:TonB-dependent receptor [Acetobacter pasteurianus]ASC06736.1 Ferrichrome receptor FcuA [Acetobacter pasteurianus subsp. pasteurianus]BAH99671.1 ferrichrome siderophore receptor FcuA [Acetobacter pasteurianus IFO 3283-01]BAI02724.1 ferrichrome siderophore receptor FcuA [Acetobacter pasteurianus IFO 3283-03]BAI05770.1 ferrichrome siderophore receptor FcuA [Acetobacter pasteurianus IFO 3283-07]BAI08819.1 ferrichrome siderophore receptor FcuA [Acetobacter pasteurianus IFO 3283-22]